MVIYVSDNESWVDTPATAASAAGDADDGASGRSFQARNPGAKLVCIDLQPYSTAQAVDTGRNDVLNIGGFSDHVFDVIAEFAKGTLNTDHWVGVIDRVSL